MILLWYYSYVCYHVFCFSLVVWFSCWRGVNDVTIDMFSLKIGNYQIKLLIYLSSTLSWIFLMCSSFLQPNMLKTSILFPNDGFPFGFSTMFSWNHLDTMWKQPRLICCKSPKKGRVHGETTLNSLDRHRSRFFLSASLRGDRKILRAFIWGKNSATMMVLNSKCGGPVKMPYNPYFMELWECLKRPRDIASFF